MWSEITNQDELKNFMELTGGFHDSCLKEFRYTSGAFVDKDLSMYPVNNQRVLKVIIQRQFNNPSALEMEFIGLKHLSMFPADEAYTCEILDATMLFKEGCIYWCDCGGLSESGIDGYDGTLICAQRMRWRAADEYIGKEEVYKN